MTYRIITARGELDTNGYVAALNFVFEDLSNYSERLTNYTQQLELPDTEVNRRIFDHWSDFNVQSDFDPNKSLKCEVVADGVTVFDGVLKLDAVSREGATLTYLVTIQSVDRVFADTLRDVNLLDLDWSKFNHIRTVDAISNSWSTPIGDGYVYPKIQYGPSDASTTYLWNWNPALYAKTIWDQVFQTAGFTYTSDFLESEYFRRIILPHTKEKIEMSQEQIDSISTRVGVTPDLPVDQSGSIFPEYFSMANDGAVIGGWLYTPTIPLTAQTGSDFADPGNQYQTDHFVATKAGYYDIDFRANLGFKYFNAVAASSTLESGGLEYHYEMILEKAAGGSVIIADSGRKSTNPYGVMIFTPIGDRTNNVIYTTEGQEINAAASSIWLEPGDEIRIQFSFSNPEENDWSSGVGNGDVTVWPIIQRTASGVQTVFSATPSSNNLLSDFEVAMDQVVPDMDAITFVSDLVTRFNLTFIPNPALDNDIIIEPIDTYLNTQKDIVDWSEKLDHAQYEIRPTAIDVAHSYVYRDAADTDYFNELYTNDHGSVYGEQRVITTNEFNIDETVIESEFASTPVAAAFDASQYVQPWFVKIQTLTDSGTPENIEAMSVKPRLLFYGGLLPVQEYIIAESVTGTTYAFTEYPYCGHWDHPTNPRWDLNWGITDTRYWPSDLTSVKTVYNQFHRNSVLNRVSPDSRVLEGRFDLTAQDIKDLDPRTRINIDGAIWRLIRVDNWTTSETLTQVTLIKVLDIAESVRTTFATPNTYAACPADLIARKSIKNNFYYYASTSGQPVTAECCEFLGGTWQSGLCKVPNVSPPKPSRPAPTPVSPSSRNILVAQKGSIGTKSSVSSRGSNNIIGSKSVNVNISGDRNSLNTANNVYVQGDNNTLYSTFRSQIVGAGNTVEDKTQFLPGGSTQAVVFGDDNVITPGLTQVTIIGSDITAVSSSVAYIQNPSLLGTMRVPVVATRPTNPVNGQVIYKIGASKILHEIYYNGVWYSTIMA